VVRTAYLEFLQQFALEPGMIDVSSSIGPIAVHLDRVNAMLRQHLVACQDCFYPVDRVAAQVWAGPIDPKFGVDAFCNVQVRPVALIIDVSRVVPADWPRLVAHEYAHAIVGDGGHSRRYAEVLQHLCRGWGWELLPTYVDGGVNVHEVELATFPPCRSTLKPVDFWRSC
jgi:hypothetical protein